MVRSRLDIRFALPALALVLAGCTTEVVSLTHGEASLEVRPGLAPLWLTNSLFAQGADDVQRLELVRDGEPVLLEDGTVMTVSNSASLVTMSLSPGTADLGFARDGEILVEAKGVKLEVDRYTYLLAYGPSADPAVQLVSDRPADEPEGTRRIRVIHIREDHAPIDAAVVDADGNPVAELSTTLEYGAAWTPSVPEGLTRLQLDDPSGSTGVMFDCGPTETLVLEDDQPLIPIGLVPSDPNTLCPGGDCACPSGGADDGVL